MKSAKSYGHNPDKARHPLPHFKAYFSMVTQGNETQIGLQNFFERYIQLFTCFYQDIMKVTSSDHTAKFPNCYFTHLFILNSILNQGYSDPFSFSSLKTLFIWLSWIHFFYSVFLTTSSCCQDLLFFSTCVSMYIFF